MRLKLLEPALSGLAGRHDYRLLSVSLTTSLRHCCSLKELSGSVRAKFSQHPEQPVRSLPMRFARVVRWELARSVQVSPAFAVPE